MSRVAYVSAFGAVLDGVTDDAAAIRAAYSSLLNTAGRPVGDLIVDGPARIASPLVFDLGVSTAVRFASSGLATATSQAGRFRLTCLGPIVADAGLDNAVTVRNGFGPVLDVAFEGGGDVDDNALHLENLLGVDLVRLSGVRYAGTLLHVDGTATAAKVAQASIGTLYADSCGRLLSLTGCEGFGQITKAWDVACTSGSVFVNCADVGIGHWESYSVATQSYGLDFQSCNSFQVGALTLGDRPGLALVRVQGGNFGRIVQLRASGRSDGGYSGDGLLLDGVTSIDVGALHTFRCGGAGLHIVGGGGNGIRVAQHFSMTSDGEPLRIDPGTSSAPRVRVCADYRFSTRAAVLVAAGLTGGLIQLDGYAETMWTSGPSGQYAIDCRSGAVTLDLTGWRGAPRAGLAGYVNPAATGVVGTAGSIGPGGWVAFR